MENKRTFVLGVGCQKGGTTWLMGYLNVHPECVRNRFKEFHVLDAHFYPEKFANFQNWRLRFIQKTCQESGPIEELSAVHPIHFTMELYTATKDIRAYPLLIDRCGTQEDGTWKIATDITPSYCALRAEHLTIVKKLLDDQGIDTRVIFLMREPIERLYSCMRNLERESDTPDAIERFESESQDWQHKIRSDYAATVTALDEVFPENKVHYAFYEQLFSDKELTRITEFLGLTPKAANFEKRWNASPSEMKLSKDQIANAREYYDWVYQFCADRFGEKLIKEIWTHY